MISMTLSLIYHESGRLLDSAHPRSLLMSGIARSASAAAVLLSVLAIPQRPAADTSALQTTPALLADFQWRGIGPANMSGRVTDIGLWPHPVANDCSR